VGALIKKYIFEYDNDTSPAMNSTFPSITESNFEIFTRNPNNQVNAFLGHTTRCDDEEYNI
jgi:hypothetical protein